MPCPKPRPIIQQLECRTLLSGYTLHTLASFASGGASDPQQTVVRDSTGTIFGIADFIGSSSNGGIYQLPTGSSNPQLVASFAAAGPFSPSPVGLLIDGNDNIFGVQELGGDANHDGTVFEVPKGGSAINTLAQFDQATSGNGPNGNIIADSAGNIYGVTNSGGTTGAGTVWKFDITSDTITALANFPRGTGIDITPSPNGITMDIHGNLFGTTSGDPLAGNYGTVWELPAGQATIQTLVNFNGSNGSIPHGPLVIDGSGNIFGETQYGGTVNNGNTPAGLGTIFEIIANSNTVTSLASFAGTNGNYPLGGLVVDSAGNLFGVCSQGGNTTGNPEGSGNVFEIPAGTGTITPLATFNMTNGELPEGGVTLDSSGDIFGTTSAGGSTRFGTVYELTPGGGGGGGGGGGNLSATIVSKAPAAIIAGQKFKASFTATVTNTATTAVNETATASLYLSQNGAVDANAINVVAPAPKKIRLKPNAHTKVATKVGSIPATVPAGTYQFILVITLLDGTTIQVVVPATVSVAAPHIDLTGSFAKLKTTARAGKKLGETITVFNLLGNVNATGTLPIVIETSPDGIAADGTALVTINKKINIKPGKFARIGLTFTAPATPGSFFIVVDLDPQNTLKDIDPTNNVFTSPVAAVVS